MEPKVKKVAILTNGGDAPGLNAVIRAIVKRASQEKDWEVVKSLVADYSPAFKLHFYIISLVLIVSFLNSFYGFGKIVLTGNKDRLKSLVIQSVFSVLFLTELLGKTSQAV